MVHSLVRVLSSISYLFTGHALLHPPQSSRKRHAAIADASRGVANATQWNSWVRGALKGVRSRWGVNEDSSASAHPEDDPDLYAKGPSPWTSFKRPTANCPSLFVAVMARRKNFGRRALIRKMWKDASKGWGKVDAKFAVCKYAAEDEQPHVIARLTEETEEHQDVMLLNCVEGYTDGLLTRKTKTAMEAFVRLDGFDLFMKTDDDTFVSPGRLCTFISSEAGRPQNFENVYMGVFAETGERVHAQRPPCRDPTSQWYEPKEKYDRPLYPPSAKGGPGYILSKAMVQKIITTGIADKWVLNNEDKAVGVWVNELRTFGFAAEIMNLPGTDGYVEYHDGVYVSGPYNWYPYALHHHLKGTEIACLHRIDAHAEPSAKVDDCFTNQERDSKLYLDLNDNLIGMRSSDTYRQVAQTADQFSNNAFFNETSDEYVLACMGAL